MKERITFVPQSDDFDPSQLQSQNGGLQITSLKAAREDRLTFSLDELPEEIRRVLKQCHELHLRWATSKPFPFVAPFLSRISPGLHIFFTPHRDRASDLICPLFQKIFGARLQCLSPEDVFTETPSVSSRFTSTAALQYYEPLPSMEALVTYILQKICSKPDSRCSARVDLLNLVNWLDVDYDTIGQVLTLTTFSHTPPVSTNWNEYIPKRKSIKVEVGVLGSEKAIEPEELRLSGFLTVIGEDKEPNPTQFSFPSRYHPLPAHSNATFLSALPPPTGLHPTFRLSFPSSATTPPSTSCALHAYLTLPSSLFVDKYQLSSPNFLASKGLRAIRAISGETDLEAPDWVVPKWGSAILLELAPPLHRTPSSSQSSDGLWHADIPLHLRYLPPTAGGIADIQIPWPVVFWACPAEEGTKMNVNPFDRVNLGYDGLFGPRTMFYHLQPKPPAEGENLMEMVRVPVLDPAGTGWVEFATTVTIILGMLWLFWRLWRPLEQSTWQRKKTA